MPGRHSNATDEATTAGAAIEETAPLLVAGPRITTSVTMSGAELRLLEMSGFCVSDSPEPPPSRATAAPACSAIEEKRRGGIVRTSRPVARAGRTPTATVVTSRATHWCWCALKTRFVSSQK